ncbi:hypothetical protein RB594_009950 [Gaeumannomyces avenae]
MTAMKGVPSSPGVTCQSAFLAQPNPQDPYRYQVGFGNRFVSEAIPGTLPRACNTPQKVKYNLYAEQLNGSTVATARATIQHVWMYRIYPAVAQGRCIPQASLNPHLESRFGSSNEKVEFVPHALCWRPLPIPSPQEKLVDFVQGLKTLAGTGDPTTNEGVAISIYCANRSMGKRAFCSNDGDFLILPQQGRLDIQTEFGKMMVRPGELVVIQAGIYFSVGLPDGNSRGYVQELFGSHYELPELGPMGSNGLAMPRDFEFPIASFDLDNSEWEIVTKLAGKLWTCKKSHSPFDVVAWHGNYIPYKYALEKFVSAAVADRDQSDPTIACVLTARSRTPGVQMVDFMAFTPRWNVASDSYRLPYYHRNMAAEIMGLIYGKYGGSSKDLRPGGLNVQPSYMPHGETHRAFMEATTKELRPERVGEGSLAFMFQVAAHCSVTKYGLEETGSLTEAPASLWADMEGHFFDHMDEANEDLARMGLQQLGAIQRS